MFNLLEDRSRDRRGCCCCMLALRRCLLGRVRPGCSLSFGVSQDDGGGWLARGDDACRVRGKPRDQRKRPWCTHRGVAWRGMAATSSIHMNMFGPHPIVVHGTTEQKDRWIPPLISGEDQVCFGVTEPDAGLDTTASRPSPVGSPAATACQAGRSGLRRLRLRTRSYFWRGHRGSLPGSRQSDRGYVPVLHRPGPSEG